MEHTPRLFSCIRCHAQVIICPHCDRGQIYCSSECSAAARFQSCRAAEKRYQLTLKGKMMHAMRQRRYRARLKEKMTDHSSRSPAQNALLCKVKNKANESVVSHAIRQPRCCFCKKSVSSLFRTGFLRHHVPRTSRNLFYLRPP